MACGPDDCLIITVCTVPVPCTGTLFWLLASNSYPDYDGYTVYTSKVAVQQPAPAWPQLSPELVDAVGQIKYKFDIMSGVVFYISANQCVQGR